MKWVKLLRFLCDMPESFGLVCIAVAPSSLYYLVSLIAFILSFKLTLTVLFCGLHV